MTRHTKELLLCLISVPLILAILLHALANQPSSDEQTQASVAMTKVGWPD